MRDDEEIFLLNWLWEGGERRFLKLEGCSRAEGRNLTEESLKLTSDNSSDNPLRFHFCISLLKMIVLLPFILSQ